MSTLERILLLGGGGFMGRALATRLRDRDSEVHIVTQGPLFQSPAGITVHNGGMENIEQLLACVPQFDVVVHLASATTPSLSRTAPSLEANGNIAPTLRVLETLQRYPRIRLVYLSSGGAVYGNHGQSSASESDATQPLSYYAAGKLAIETFLRCFQHLAGNPVTILRPSNLYGPGQPRYQGFAVVRTMLQHLLDGTTMEIWGDGSVVRDYIHIDDVTAAIECVLSDASATGTFNVGSGIGYSLNELAQLVEHVSGERLMVRHEPSRSIDVQSVVLDSSAMQQIFGWTPRISLADGIADTWNWLRTQQ